MPSKQIALVLLGMLASFAARSHGRCGNESVAPSKRAWVEIESRLASVHPAFDLRPASVLPAKLVVPLYFHILTDELVPVTQAALDRQLAVLRDAYAPVMIEFEHKGTFEYPGLAGPSLKNAELRDPIINQAIRSHRKGGRESLNVFIVKAAAPFGASVLGMSAFPWDAFQKPELDAVVVEARTLPGIFAPGAVIASPYDQGKTLVHEVGHWFGLFHVFKGGCEKDGDEVDDTPAQRAPLHLCVPQRTCNLQVDDPIHNYMGYTADSCQTEFTWGQQERMRFMFLRFRTSL